MRPALTLLAGIVVLAAAGCGGGGSDSASPPEQASAARPALTDLKSVDTLKNDFNADAGRSRLLLIFSPT